MKRILWTGFIGRTKAALRSRHSDAESNLHLPLLPEAKSTRPLEPGCEASNAEARNDEAHPTGRDRHSMAKCQGRKISRL